MDYSTEDDSTYFDGVPGYCSDDEPTYFGPVPDWFKGWEMINEAASEDFDSDMSDIWKDPNPAKEHEIVSPMDDKTREKYLRFSRQRERRRLLLRAAAERAKREEQEWKDNLRRTIAKEDVAAKAEVLAALKAVQTAEAAGTHSKEALDLSKKGMIYELHCAEHLPHVPWYQLETMSVIARRIEMGRASDPMPSDDPMGDGFDREIGFQIWINNNSENFLLPTSRASSKVWELDTHAGPKVEITFLGWKYIIAKVPRELALESLSKAEIAKAPKYFTFYGLSSERLKRKRMVKAKAKAQARAKAKAQARGKAPAQA